MDCVIALDLGATTGMAVVGCTDQFPLLAHQTFRLNTPHGQVTFATSLQQLLLPGGPHCVGLVVEGNPFVTAHHRDPRIGLRITRAQAKWRGMVEMTAALCGLAVVGSMTPTAAKKALTGYGTARKEGMMQAAALRTGQALTEHESDAYGVGVAFVKQRLLQRKFGTGIG